MRTIQFVLYPDIMDDGSGMIERLMACWFPLVFR